MGYRSDVAYVIKFDDIQTRDAYVTLMLANDNEYVRSAMEEDCEYHYTNDPIITFRDDDTKWYDSYPEVIAHTFIYRNAYELKMGSYRFLAIGEDGAEDFDQEELHDMHNMYDYVFAVHKLQCNF